MKLLLRIIILIICVFTFFNALVFVGLSVYRSIHAYISIYHGNVEERPGLHLVESLDGFLIAIVFLIFSIGFGKLFIPDMKILENIQLSWLNPKSFSDLKQVLWEAILTTLVVLFSIEIVQDINHLGWNHLIIPGSVVLIAGGLKLLKSSH